MKLILSLMLYFSYLLSDSTNKLSKQEVEIFSETLKQMKVKVNWRNIYPLCNSYYSKVRNKREYSSAIWIEENITNYNKKPIIEKNRYIFNGNYFTKINQNEFEKKDFGIASKPYHKVYQRIVKNSKYLTVTTVRKSGESSELEYHIGFGVTD